MTTEVLPLPQMSALTASAPQASGDTTTATASALGNTATATTLTPQTPVWNDGLPTSSPLPWPEMKKNKLEMWLLTCKRASERGWIFASDRYETSTKKHRFVCPGFNGTRHLILMSPGVFNMKPTNGCQKCLRNTDKSPAESYYAFLAGCGATPIDPYVKAIAPTRAICPKGHLCLTTPHDVQRWKRLPCRRCANKSPEQAAEKFSGRIIELGGRQIDKYTDTHTKVHCICAKGHDCWPRPIHVNQGSHICILCVRRTPELVEQEVRAAVHLQGGTVDGKYVDNNTPIDCTCPMGHKCAPTPACLIRGTSMCKQCASFQAGCFYRLTTEDFIERSVARYGANRFDYSQTDYKLSWAPITLICLEHKETFTQIAAIHLRGTTGCLSCRQERTLSAGARFVVDYLKERKISTFTMEAKLPGLPNRRYDFCIAYGGRNFMIEFDGDQHFTPNNMWFKSIEEFQESQEIDKIKNYVAVLSGYIMVRISISRYDHITRFLDVVLTAPQHSHLNVDDIEEYHHMWEPLNTDLVKKHCPKFDELMQQYTARINGG